MAKKLGQHELDYEYMLERPQTQHLPQKARFRQMPATTKSGIYNSNQVIIGKYNCFKTLDYNKRSNSNARNQTPLLGRRKMTMPQNPTSMLSQSDLYSTDEESKKRIYLQGHTSSMKKNLDNVRKVSPVKVR